MSDEPSGALLGSFNTEPELSYPPTHPLAETLDGGGEGRDLGTVVHGLHTFQWLVGLFLGVFDIALWIFAYYLISTLTGSYNHFTLRPLVLPIMVLMAALSLVRGYRAKTNFASLQYASEHLIACIGSFPIAAFFLFVIASFEVTVYSSRAILLGNVLIFTAFSLLIRRIYWFSTSKMRQSSQFFAIVDQKLGPLFYHDYNASEQYQTVHYIGAKNSQVGRGVADTDSPVIEFGTAQLGAFLKKGNIFNIDGIIIAAKISNLDEVLLQKLLSVHFDGVPVYSLGNFYEYYWNRLPLELVGPDWVIESHINLVKNSFLSVLKRFWDIVIPLALLIILAPLFILLIVLIFLMDGTPVIYSQQRVGHHQIPFTLYKFRTMKVGSDRENPYTQEEDSRVTRLGAFLRKTRMDELPQLWNVLRGEMSLIGPRAEWVKLVETYEKEIPHYHLRHLVRPGITGWAQVKYPYGSTLEDTLQKLSYDLYYISNYSIKLEAAVMLKTIYVILFGKGR